MRSVRVDAAMLQRTWEEFQCHLNIRRAIHGVHTERIDKTWILSLHTPSYFTVTDLDN